MKGNIPLIDAVAAFVIILAIYSTIGQNYVDCKAQIENYIKREEIRALFYEEVFSGRLNFSDFSDGKELPNGLEITKIVPSNGSYLCFFLSGDDGIRVFYVCGEG